MNYIRNLLVRQLLWMAQSDPDSVLPPAAADPTLLGMDAMTSQLFNEELFLDVYEKDDYRLDATAPQWQATFGTLEQDGTIWKLRPVCGQAIPLHPGCRSGVKDRGSGVPMVLMHDEKNPGSEDQILVTEEEYRLADPFPSFYDKAYMLLEYLNLEQPHRKLVFDFLTSEDQAEAMFDDLCQTALTACRSAAGMAAVCEASQAVPGRRILLELLGFFGGKLELDLRLLWVLLTVRTLTRRLGETEDSCVLDELMNTEMCCRNPALAECVERALPLQKAEDFAKLLLSVDCDCVEAYAFAQIRFWLFALLESRISLSPPVLREICRKHFCHPLTGRMLRSLRSGLFCSNGAVLQACIESLYPEGYGVDRSGFPAALAVSRMHDMQYMATPIQEEAQNLLLDGEDDAELLLGIAMLNVFLQFRTEHIRSHREPAVLSREAKVAARVLQWLQEPRSIFYPHVCELAHQLYLSCAVPEHAFAHPQVITAACIAWHERICPARVELLLSTLPMGMVLPQSDALDQMRRALQRKFDRAMLGENEGECLIPLFRCCAVLGGWEKSALQHRFRLLLRSIDKKYDRCSAEDREYMRRLDWDMLQCLFGSTGRGDGTGFRLLYETAVPLPAPEQKALRKAACAVVSDRSQAMGLLSAFRQTFSQKKAKLDSIAELFRRCKLDIPEPYLITDWFYALCTMGLSVQAQEFYLLHKEVLDRPWVYLPDSRGLSVERPFHAASCFWNGPTRREKGLELAAEMGHAAALWPLAQQHENSSFRQCRSVPNRKQVLSFFRMQYSPGKKRMMNYWMTHYDDYAVTRAALADPDNHSTILHFGYCGSREMVLAALQADPAHVCYASKALLKDDRVALTVLQQSCRYLHLLFAPVTEDRELIKAMILRQQEPVVLNRTKKWIRDDKDLMLQSVRKYPQYFELVSDRLRRDREVVLAALDGALCRTYGSDWLRHILRYTTLQLRRDPDVIRCMQIRCPGYDGEEDTDIAFVEE